MSARRTRSRRALLGTACALMGVLWFACGDSPTGPLAEGEIGPAGGELRADGVVLNVPAGALPARTRITIRRASPSDLPASVGARTDSIVPGTLYDFGPDGLTFAAPVTLELEYDPAELPSDARAGRLAIARIDDALEVLTDVVVDTVATTLTTQVDHFTFFGAYGPLALPEVRIVVEEQVMVRDAVPPGAVAGPTTVREAVAISDVVTVTAPGFVRIDVAESVAVSDDPGASAPEVAVVEVSETVGVTDQVEVTPIADATLYVVSGAGSLELFDPTGPTATGSVPLPSSSYAIDRRPGTDTLWVTERATDSVSVVDAGSNTVVGRFYSSTQDPITLDFASAGSVALIGDNDVSRATVLEAATGTLIGAVRELPEQVNAADISPDGSTAWTARARVTRIDIGSLTATDTSAMGILSFATDMDLTPDGSELWVTDGVGGAIVVLDPAALTVVDSVYLSAGTSTGGEQLVFTEDGSTAYASTATAGEIVVIDVASRAELDRYYTGGRIDELVLDADRNRIFGTSATTDELIVFDLGTTSTLERRPVTTPTGLILHP